MVLKLPEDSFILQAFSKMTNTVILGGKYQNLKKTIKYIQSIKKRWWHANSFYASGNDVVYRFLYLKYDFMHN